MTVDPDTGNAIREAVQQRLGLAIPDGIEWERAQGRILEAFTGIPRRLLSHHLSTISEDSEDWSRLTSAVTIGETFFFRDLAWFATLERDVFMPLIAERRAAGRLGLRIWSAGCATGEEPYSLAMALDRLLPDRAAWSIQILGTDVDLIALQTARRGTYRTWSLRETPSHVVDRFFRRHGAGAFELDPMIRDMVTFAPLNLAGDRYPAVDTGTFENDLIVCRNVLMYFRPTIQRAAAQRLGAALAAGGWLAVSPAEAAAELFRPLRVVNLPGAILFRRLPVRQPAPSPPAWPPGAALPVTSSLPPLATGDRDTRKRQAAQPPSGPSDPRHALQQARAMADRGQYAEARALCERTLSRNPGDFDGQVLLAQTCRELNDWSGAHDALRRALYLQPDSPRAHFMMGMVLDRGDRRAAARRYMANAVRLLKDPATGRPDRGRTVEDGWLLDAAEAYLRGAPRNGDLPRESA